MAVSTADLKLLVNSGPSDDEVLDQCLAFGESVVETYTRRVTPAVKATIPPPILDEAILVASADQFQRRKAPNGVLNQVFDSGDGFLPVRISRDPYESIRHLLAPWISVKSGLRSVRLVTGGDR